VRTTAKERAEVVARLVRLGISGTDAEALRRVAMTLRNWFEMECGTDRNGASVSIEREGGTDDGKPFQRVQYNSGGRWVDRQYPIADREKGARKRLADTMKRYPELTAYVQGDCRGASVYILRNGQDIKPGDDINAIYSRGVAVY
jgi:hypothetical protein